MFIFWACQNHLRISFCQSFTALSGLSLGGVSLEGVSLEDVSLEGVSLEGVSQEGVSQEGLSEATLFEELCASTPSWAKFFPGNQDR